MRPEVEENLAHTLLVELLANQFCNPVRWIETQDVLLSKSKSERILEIGPGNTLVDMMKRTLTAKQKEDDAALQLRRKLLSYKRDAKEMYFETGAPRAAESDSKPHPPIAGVMATSTPPIAAEAIPTALPEAPGTGAVPHLAGSSVPVPDVPISATEIVHMIVARNIKKAMTEVATSNTIKGLAAGRSTLQNEIIGDLDKEFGNLPSNPEEMSLDDLSATLQASFSGRLGKLCESLVGRFLASKMSGGFNASVARKYLQDQWGFGPGRQDGVLVIAVSMQPAARLAQESECKAFLNTIVESYVAKTGLVLQAPAMSAHQTGGAGTAIDPAALDFLKKDQERHNQEMLRLYAKALEFDLDAGDKSALAAKEALELLQPQLNLWLNEYGEDHAMGIAPVFKPRKARLYDSAWAWAMQDLVTLFYDLSSGRIAPGDEELPARCAHIADCANPQLLQAMRFLLTRCTRETPNHETTTNVITSLINECRQAERRKPRFVNTVSETSPKTTIDSEGKITYNEVPRTSEPIKRPACHDETPTVRILRKDLYDWCFDSDLTKQHSKALSPDPVHGISFDERYVLITGAGRGSIGAAILRGLLRGGAKVVACTSSYSPETAKFYQSLYSRYGARGSQLVVVPFNQGSKQDVEALVSYIYDENAGLGWDLDHVIPFAAIPEKGREIDELDGKSELAHRVLLTNTIRILGAIKTQKAKRDLRSHPAQVVLPLSPNHGSLGNDGLYAESKIGLETLMNKWHSENWSDYLSVCGAVIGWTRGTGLMSGNDLVAEAIEEHGVRTFSQEEMAANIVALMSPAVLSACQTEPLLADFSGDMNAVPDLKSVVTKAREDINSASAIRRAIAQAEKEDLEVLNGSEMATADEPAPLERRAEITLQFPRISDYEAEIQPLTSQLHGMVDLESVVVVVGYSEVGPLGSSRTRWDLEAHGEFSLEGCLEMAWTMGLIKSHNGPLAGKPYAGWVDTSTGQPISAEQVKSKYEKYIMENSGIRLSEPSANEADPHTKQLLHEVVLQADFEQIEVPKEQAEDLKRVHGDKAEIFEMDTPDQYRVCLKKGAVLLIPKASKIHPRVYGRLPNGWDARKYGISEDIISQVDPVTLYILIATVEALLSAGITDPYEIYKYIHVSQVGLCVGSGTGGLTSTKGMYNGRMHEKSVQSDVLQETFINTSAAWVNMLLLSSSGPIKTPVGACATSLESLDTGYDLITSGKTKLCFVGGCDDNISETSDEFANMKATINTADDAENGRAPHEASRPATTSRKGFVEAQGSGVQMITSAALALEMGLPIYGVVAWTGMASDKTGRSVPAPGKGTLTFARETPGKLPSPLLNLGYRRRLMESRLQTIDMGKEAELEYLEDTCASHDESEESAAEFLAEKERIISDAERQKREVVRSYGNEFWKGNSSIAPLRGALATWGLTIDDLNVVSFHGTSTVKGELNELDVIHSQLEHLGRKPGNGALAVFQKYLTGHPKGAAGAWMLNGGLQILDSGIVPGNRNLDNVDSALAKYSHVAFTSDSVQTQGLNAFSVTSFGFGQKGAQAIGVHSRFLYAAVDREEYETYLEKLERRKEAAYIYFTEALAEGKLFVAKDAPPYPAEKDKEFLLDTNARVA